MALALAALIAAITQVDLGADVDRVDDVVTFIESVVQDLVFLGLGALFLVGLEGRLKRREALAGIHELRSFAHVIDMHQLTKDPDVALGRVDRTKYSPDRIDDLPQLGRYLEYCSEMLAITSKLAATYAQDMTDGVALAAVRDVQDLVGLLSGKIWQKRVILDGAASS